MEKQQNKLEQTESEEAVTSKIVLRFLRHAEPEPSGGKPDEGRALTDAGKIQAIDKAEDAPITQSVAFGSIRKRAQETAMLAMAGKVDMINGDETLEELKEKIGKNKIGIDDRLDFDINFRTNFGKLYLASSKKREALKFLVEQSDSLAKELNENNVPTYNYLSGRVASLLKKYLTIAPVWEKLVHNNSKNYSDTLKRFMGTHQGVAESFLAKVIELTKGLEERDVFVRSLDNQGFDFTEGFDVEVLTTESGEQKIHIQFKKQDKDGNVLFEYNQMVSVEILEKILQT